MYTTDTVQSLRHSKRQSLLQKHAQEAAQKIQMYHKMATYIAWLRRSVAYLVRINKWNTQILKDVDRNWLYANDKSTLLNIKRQTFRHKIRIRGWKLTKS